MEVVKLNRPDTCHDSLLGEIGGAERVDLGRFSRAVAELRADWREAPIGCRRWGGDIGVGAQQFGGGRVLPGRVGAAAEAAKDAAQEEVGLLGRRGQGGGLLQGGGSLLIAAKGFEREAKLLMRERIAPAEANGLSEGV